MITLEGNLISMTLGVLVFLLVCIFVLGVTIGIAILETINICKKNKRYNKKWKDFYSSIKPGSIILETPENPFYNREFHCIVETHLSDDCSMLHTKEYRAIADDKGEILSVSEYVNTFYESRFITRFENVSDKYTFSVDGDNFSLDEIENDKK